MKLKVLGCHGGETPKHRTSSFLVDGRLALDAGALTGTVELPQQSEIESVLVSHAHFDHIRDLATLADNRCQMGAKTLEICGAPETIAALKAHFFNNVLWPDFTKIPTGGKSDAGADPVIRFRELEVEKTHTVAGYKVLPVAMNHTIDSSGFIVRGVSPAGAPSTVAYSGDTAQTERFWQLLNKEPNLKACLMEVSFPNHMHSLAKISKHHTPETLAGELSKFHQGKELPLLLFHIKPCFEAETERELLKVRGREIALLRLEDEFLL